jgi:hypothetical protein
MHVLCECWANVGLELQQATKASDLRTALGAITGIDCPRLAVFLHDELLPAGGHEIARTRAEIRKLSRAVSISHQTKLEREELVHWADRAMQSAKSPYESETLRPITEKHNKGHDDASVTLAMQTAQLDALRSQLMRQEAFFAQDQFLKFVASNRRKLTPRSFAAAMAGLPFISWRQSSDRCADFWKAYPESFSYTMFGLVAKFCADGSQGPGLTTDALRKYTCRPETRDDLSCQHFREHWYFFEEAVRTAFANAPPCIAALPYRVFAEYQKRWKSQRPTDIIMKRAKQL